MAYYWVLIIQFYLSFSKLEEEITDHVIHKKLCRKEIVMSSGVAKHLKCRYVDHNNPFLKLAPFKEEEAFLDPRIVVYHDIIKDEEIETLKKLGKSVVCLQLLKDDKFRVETRYNTYIFQVSRI